ncbi:MAG: toll/interleukin-1 receptor domain-containing protein [Caldilineaceae bacterium]|nr:toll/interleukin-1 receptor domain-containing protein [Caldilineaceae bacterium]
MDYKRDHIFISYATEDWPLCEWLARRLAAEGYAIWCDRLKMLGGENWPNDIEIAIDKRTFRMLALMSRASMQKSNPQGEWLKARAVGAKLGVEDFLIPLNVEGLRSHEILWNFQTTNYINFSHSWAEGLAAVLKKLHSVSTPKVLNEGRRLALESTFVKTAISEEPELLVSNCFEIIQIPRYLRIYNVKSGALSKSELYVLRREWACSDVTPSTVIAFHDPPTSVTAKHSVQYVKQVSWREATKVDGIDSHDLAVRLIRRSLYRLMEGYGLKYSESSNNFYLPSGLLQNDRVSVILPNGRKSWFLGVGARKYSTAKGGETYRYHLSPSFDVLREQNEPSALFLRNRVHLTDIQGKELEGRKIPSRRKHLCRGWFNHEWCLRTLGMAQLLADEDMYIRYGPVGEQQLVISASPLAMEAPLKVCDNLVDDPDEIYSAWQSGEEAGIDDFEEEE